MVKAILTGEWLQLYSLKLIMATHGISSAGTVGIGGRGINSASDTTKARTRSTESSCYTHMQKVSIMELQNCVLKGKVYITNNILQQSQGIGQFHDTKDLMCTPTIQFYKVK